MRDGDNEEDGSEAGADDLEAFFALVEPVIDVLNTKRVKDGVAGVLEVNAMLGEVFRALAPSHSDSIVMVLVISSLG